MLRSNTDINVFDVRKKYDLSQEEIADILWMSRITYLNREKKNNHNFTDLSIKRLIDYFISIWIYLDLDWLFLETLQKFPDLSGRQIEEFLEFLQDKSLLNYEWDRLKNHFWTFYHKTKI